MQLIYTTTSLICVYRSVIVPRDFGNSIGRDQLLYAISLLRRLLKPLIIFLKLIISQTFCKINAQSASLRSLLAAESRAESREPRSKSPADENSSGRNLRTKTPQAEASLSHTVFQIFDFKGFRVWPWPLKVTWGQKYFHHSKAHTWLPI